MSQLHVWSIVRLLPNMQCAVINRFRRRGDAENYLSILRRYNPEGNFLIIFDPPSEEHRSKLLTNGDLNSRPPNLRSTQN